MTSCRSRSHRTRNGPPRCTRPSLDVSLDVDADGNADYIVFGQELGGFGASGQCVVYVANLSTGSRRLLLLHHRLQLVSDGLHGALVRGGPRCRPVGRPGGVRLRQLLLRRRDRQHRQHDVHGRRAPRGDHPGRRAADPQGRIHHRDREPSPEAPHRPRSRDSCCSTTTPSATPKPSKSSASRNTLQGAPATAGPLQRVTSRSRLAIPAKGARYGVPGRGVGGNRDGVGDPANGIGTVAQSVAQLRSVVAALTRSGMLIVSACQSSSTCARRGFRRRPGSPCLVRSGNEGGRFEQGWAVPGEQSPADQCGASGGEGLGSVTWR